MSLNAHPLISKCVVVKGDPVGNDDDEDFDNDDFDDVCNLHVHIHPTKVAGDALSGDAIHDYLVSKGFSGGKDLCKIQFVDDADVLPEGKHERVVLMDLILAVFADAGCKKYDNAVLKDEFMEWFKRSEITSPADPELAFIRYDTDSTGALHFDQFKAFLLKERLIALQDNTNDGIAAEFYLHPGLMPTVSDFFFTKADGKGVNKVDIDDLVNVYQQYRVGTEEEAMETFAMVTCLTFSDITKKEFQDVLMTTGIVSHKVELKIAYGFNDAATTQMSLNSHPMVSKCVVREDPDDGLLLISILPAATAKGKITDQLIFGFLKSKGFTGDLGVCELDFVQEEAHLPQSTHNRVVLIDLLLAILDDADKNNDNMISKHELDQWLSVDRRWDKFAVIAKFDSYDINKIGLLSYEQFKNLLLDYPLVALQDNTGDGVASDFYLHPALVKVVAHFFFTKADKRKCGEISMADLREVFKDYRLGSAEDASEAFALATKGSGKNIDADSFGEILKMQGVISHDYQEPDEVEESDHEDEE